MVNQLQNSSVSGLNRCSFEIIYGVEHMGKNLAQTPLTAVFYAAIYCFLAPFLKFSEGYSAALAGYSMPNLGYIFMIAYGFWISLALALIFSNARGKSVILAVLMAIPFLVTQAAAPMIQQIVFGETSNVMTQSDSIFKLIQSAASIVLLLILGLLLFKAPHAAGPPKPPGALPKAPDKYKLKKRDFIIKLIVLPVIYMVVYFLARYFLLLSNEAARVYYSVSADTNTFAKYLVNIMLDDSRQIPMALIRGLLYSFSLIPLMLQLAHKRVMFFITSIMLLLGPAVQMLIPSPVMDTSVRFAHLIEISAGAVVFGALCAFMLHTSVFKEQSKMSPHTAPAAPAGKAKAEAAAPAAK